VPHWSYFFKQRSKILYRSFEDTPTKYYLRKGTVLTEKIAFTRIPDIVVFHE